METDVKEGAGSGCGGVVDVVVWWQRAGTESDLVAVKGTEDKN